MACVSTRSFGGNQSPKNQRIAFLNCVNISLPLDKRLFVLYLRSSKLKKQNDYDKRKIYLQGVGKSVYHACL